MPTVVQLLLDRHGEAGLGALLVGVMILLLLGSWRSTVIILIGPKNLLGQVQTDYANLLHGWLPSFVSSLIEWEPSTPSSRGGNAGAVI